MLTTELVGLRHYQRLHSQRHVLRVHGRYDERQNPQKKSGLGSVVIIVPVVIGAVFLAAGAYAVARKRKTAVAQRRMSHRAASMPSVVAE